MDDNKLVVERHGKVMLRPETNAWRAEVRSVLCPRCGALPGHQCVGNGGRLRIRCHVERWDRHERGV